MLPQTVTHVPRMHEPTVFAASAAQTSPHAPQFAGSVAVSTHAPPHTPVDAPHVSATTASPTTASRGPVTSARGAASAPASRALSGPGGGARGQPHPTAH